MNMEELTIKLDGTDATVLLDALGKALGQPGLKMELNQDYVDA